MATEPDPRAKQKGRAARFQILPLIPVGLVMGILLSMGWGISDVVQGMEVRLTWAIIGVGLVVGWLVARVSRRRITSILFALFGGALFTAMMIGRLWDDLWELVSNLAVWTGTSLNALISTSSGEPTLPSFGNLFIILHTFTESVFLMLQRFVLWVWHFPKMNSDLIASLLIWGLVVWLTTLWAAWSLVRHRHPLEAVLPAIVVTAAARMYANASPNTLLLMLGAAVVMVVLSGQIGRERDWKLRGMGYSELTRKHSTQAALMLSAALVFTAWGITSIETETIKDLWNEVTNKQYYYSSGEVRSSLGIEEDEKRAALVEEFSRLRRGNLPNSHLIGSSPELAEEVVMVVKVQEVDPLTGDAKEVDPAAQAYYFRSLTFDQYSARGWYSNSSKIYVYRGRQEAISSYSNHQQLIRQEVVFKETLEEPGKVYAAGELAVVDEPYNVSWREGDGPGDFKDMFGATLESSSYTAYSLIPVFSEEDLRASGTNYPDWVLSRYLQLPKTIPSRVVDLAFELTQNEANNYDKAVAIERFLRTFPYTLDLPDRPAKVDLVDYFLFNVKMGYCDYYASSMVVLARAVGIPARLAIGYVGSKYDSEGDSFTITGDQAHSWVEIYFPEFGWVTFEPTAGRPAVERDDLGVPLPEFEQEIVPAAETSRLNGLRVVLQGLMGLVALILLMGLIWLRAETFFLRRMPVEKTFRVIYRRLLWLGERIGIGQGVSQTPLEFSDLVQSRLETWMQDYPSLIFLSGSALELEALIGLINKAAFCQEFPGQVEQAQAVEFWVALRRKLAVAMLWKWFADRMPWKRRLQEGQSVI